MYGCRFWQGMGVAVAGSDSSHNPLAGVRGGVGASVPRWRMSALACTRGAHTARLGVGSGWGGCLAGGKGKRRDA